MQCLQPGAVEPPLGERQHVARQIDADAPLDLRPEQFEHPPGSRAEIEQRTKRPVRERRQDRAFHRFVGDMQAADAIPLGGMAAEIVLRRAHARRAHGGEPFAVAGEYPIVRIEPGDQDARQFGRLALLGKTEERPRALAEALDQPRLGEQPEMTRNPRLRLAQDVGQVRYRQLVLGEQRENAHTRFFRGGLQRRIEIVEDQAVIPADAACMSASPNST